MKPILYTMPGTIGVASHIALEESGLDYDYVKVDFASQEHLSANYRAINPKLRVPALVVGHAIVTETPAILFLVAQLSATSLLALPDDALDIAEINSFNGYLSSTVHVAHAHKYRGSRWTDDTAAIAAMAKYVPVSMSGCFELIESSLLKGPWVHGDRFSISDPYLFAISLWLEGDEVDISRYPKVQAHYRHMMQRDSVRKVLSFT